MLAKELERQLLLAVELSLAAPKRTEHEEASLLSSEAMDLGVGMG